MKDMELVIRIDKDIAQGIIYGENDAPRNIVRAFQATIADAIKNSIQLPEGHGKLVDVNSIPEEDKNIIVKSLLHPGTIAYAGAINLEEYINGLPTIIEKDKRESEN